MPSVPAQSMVKVTASVAGIDLGSFITHSGGQVSGESLKIRPGAGEREVVYGGTKTYDPITLSKLYDDALRSKRLWLAKQVNRAPMIVSMQPLDADENPFGKADSAVGILIRFTPPDSDANATGDGSASTAELEMSVEDWA